MTPRRLLRSRIAIVALSGLAACSSGSDSNTNPAISLAIAPASGTALQGGSSAIVATVTGSGGFGGTVTFTVAGQPAGVTYSVTNVQTLASITSATVTFTVGGAVTTGTYPLTVTASAAGVSNSTASYSLTVNSSTQAGYQASVSPTTVGMLQGATAVETVTLTRTGGYTGSVAFTVTGLPNGVTGTFNPTSTTGNTSTLTLTAAAGATTGLSTVTIHTAASAGNFDLTFQLTVTASGGGGGGTSITLDFTNCGPTVKPIWFAYQDNNGAWTKLAGVSDVYTFSANGPKAGFATVTQFGSNTTTSVRMALVSELAGTTHFCSAPPTTKTVNVTVVGTSGTTFVNLALGGGTNFALADGPVAISSVLTGPQDFFGYRTPVVGGPVAGDRALIIRDLNVADGGSAGTADFGGGSAIVPTAATINVAGAVAGDGIVAVMGYLTGANCSFGSMYSTPTGASTALSLFGIPAASQRATDFHSLQIFARNGATTTRIASQSIHTFAAQTITLGAFPAVPTVTNLGLAAYKRLQATGTISTDYSTSTQLLYTQQGTGISAIIGATQAWIGSQTATLAFPDFTGLAGWTDSWVPAAGVAADWKWLSNYLNYTGTTCFEGAKLLSAQVTGTN